MKKTISLSFLLLANMIILAHSVVFHHHDSRLHIVLCDANQVHECDRRSEQHNNCPASKDKNKCCAIENCLLSVFITKDDGFKQTEPVVNNLDIILNAILACQTINITDLSGLPFWQKPYLPLFYSTFVSQSSGLRAPPAC